MACPYFFPESEADFVSRPKPARAPLGTVFTGTCRANAEPFVPSNSLLYEACNFGYGRRSCPTFPAGAPGDALRYTERNGAVIFILETEYSPVMHGSCDGELPLPSIACQSAAFKKTCSTK